MSHRNKTNSYTEFYYHFFRNILIVALPLLIISALILGFSTSRSSATGSGSGTDSLTISISSACTLGSVVDIEHSTNTNVGTYTSNIGKTTITTLCNDGNGYSIYADGYSNNEEGNNKLINSSYPQYSIDTGLATSGLTSAWAMKLNNIENDPSPTPPVIESDYNNTYGLVPYYWTKVASRPSGTTDMSQGSSFTTTYSVYASSSQFAGTYLGQVKYILLHPASPSPPHFYYMQDVAEWKNTLALEESVQAIDKRDGKSYWVTKLKDGHIWMTQNLDFDIVSDEQDPTKMKTLTSEDTDLTDYSLTGAYSSANGYSYDPTAGIISWIPPNTAKTINFDGTVVAGWQNSTTTPYSASKIDDAGTGHFSLGNYYNWTAAIASTNSSALTSNTLSNTQNNPKNSICPKGWRLPTVSNQSGTAIDSTNEFARLNYLYNDGRANTDEGLVSVPLWFTKSGSVGETLNNSTIYGLYWSSTVYINDKSYYMYLGNNGVGMNSYESGGRNRGFSIRCLAR